MRSRLQRQSDALRSFDEDRACLPFAGQRDAGLRTVPLKRIVGSMGRQQDFNSQFQPLRDESRQRWMRIAYQEYRGSGLPPVELYRVGDCVAPRKIDDLFNPPGAEQLTHVFLHDNGLLS